MCVCCHELGVCVCKCMLGVLGYACSRLQGVCLPRVGVLMCVWGRVGCEYQQVSVDIGIYIRM